MLGASFGAAYVPCYTCYGWNTANGLRSGARATAGGGRSGPRVVAAARLRMRLRVLLEEADALIDVLRVPVDGRHRDAGEVVREEAAGSVVVAVGGAVAAALPVRGAAGEEAQVPRAPRGDAAECASAGSSSYSNKSTLSINRVPTALWKPQCFCMGS